MSFHSEQYINDTLVAVGAVITNIVSTDRILGTTVKAGARCESLEPEKWTPVVTVDGTIVWEGEAAAPYEAADNQARHHIRESLTKAARNIFR